MNLRYGIYNSITTHYNEENCKALQQLTIYRSPKKFELDLGIDYHTRGLARIDRWAFYRRFQLSFRIALIFAFNSTFMIVIHILTKLLVDSLTFSKTEYSAF